MELFLALLVIILGGFMVTTESCGRPTPVSVTLAVASYCEIAGRQERLHVVTSTVMPSKCEKQEQKE